MSEEYENTHNEDKTPKWEPEKKSEFIDVIVRAFDGFVSTFKKNGLATVTFVLVLFMIFYAWVLNPVNINEIVTDALKKEERLRVEQQERSIEKRLEADKMINDLMTEIIDGYDVNRCLLFEIHDGSSNLSGIEFLFYSAVNEMISTNNRQGEDVYNINYESDVFQRQMISNFIGTESYRKLKHDRYLYFSDLEKYHRNNYRFVAKMKSIGAESVMIVPFVSDNIPKVLLVISSREPTMPAEKIYQTVERYRSRIEKNLMNL